jgi:hypothetical protein
VQPGIHGGGLETPRRLRAFPESRPAQLMRVRVDDRAPDTEPARDLGGSQQAFGRWRGLLAQALGEPFGDQVGKHGEHSGVMEERGGVVRQRWPARVVAMRIGAHCRAPDSSEAAQVCRWLAR